MFGGRDPVTQQRGKLESRSADRAGALVGVGQALPCVS